jgi:hypothetical protein
MGGVTNGRASGAGQASLPPLDATIIRMGEMTCLQVQQDMHRD